MANGLSCTILLYSSFCKTLILLVFKAYLVHPKGIEPPSLEPESNILSIKLRMHMGANIPFE